MTSNSIISFLTRLRDDVDLLKQEMKQLQDNHKAELLRVIHEKEVARRDAESSSQLRIAALEKNDALKNTLNALNMEVGGIYKPFLFQQLRSSQLFCKTNVFPINIVKRFHR